jgi:hypothetical protein
MLIPLGLPAAAPACSRASLSHSAHRVVARVRARVSSPRMAVAEPLALAVSLSKAHLERLNKIVRGRGTDAAARAWTRSTPSPGTHLPKSVGNRLTSGTFGPKQPHWPAMLGPCRGCADAHHSCSVSRETRTCRICDSLAPPRWTTGARPAFITAFSSNTFRGGATPVSTFALPTVAAPLSAAHDEAPSACA